MRNLALLLLVAACGDDGTPAGDAAPPGAPDGGTPAEVLSHEFPEVTVGPGEELLGQCVSWTLENDGELFVNALRLAQDAAIHGVQLFAVPDGVFDGPDGIWPCDDRAFNNGGAVAVGTYLISQNAGAPLMTTDLADGVAIHVPARARIVGWFRAMNQTDQPITGSMTLTLEHLPSATTLVTPIVLSYTGLAIPPQATSTFSATCDFGDTFVVHHAFPFALSLATRVFAEGLVDRDGSLVGADHGVHLVPVTAGPEITFGCTYVNPRSEYVGWGFGDQEQCDVLLLVEEHAIMVGTVGTAEPAGVDTFTGPCNVTAL